MASNLQLDNPLSATSQSVRDDTGAPSPLGLAADQVVIEGGPVTISNPGDGSVLLTLGTERPWVIKGTVALSHPGPAAPQDLHPSCGDGPQKQTYRSAWAAETSGMGPAAQLAREDFRSRDHLITQCNSPLHTTAEPAASSPHPPCPPKRVRRPLSWVNSCWVFSPPGVGFSPES